MNRAVMQHVAEDGPNELRLRMVARPQLRKAFCKILVLQNRNDRLISFACRRPVRLLFEVENLYFTTLLAIDSPPCFLAQCFLVQQLREPVRSLVVPVPWVFGQLLLHRIDDMCQRVKSNDVSSTIGRAFRPADERSGERINLIESQL